MIGHTFLSRKIRPDFQISLLGSSLLILFASCAGHKAGQGTSINLPAATPPAPDYKLHTAWAAHPDFYDLSDSLPAPLRPQQTDTSADVFFLHPTSYLNSRSVDEARLSEPAERFRWNAAVDDSAINRKTDMGSMLNQASAFNAYRVFAPRYRQAHIRSFYVESELAKPFFDTAYADIQKAFLYYIENENRGRPFIIASHSQGTLHAGRLIKEMIEGRPLQKQMVAAYLPGMPIADTFFTVLKPCETPGQTQCFVSWRTFKKGYVPPAVQKENFRAVVVNPLTFKVSDEWAGRINNKGSLLYKFNKPRPENVGAGIHGNILWSNKPRFLGNIFFTRKNYHIGDINLFWMNIRENVAKRIQAYMNTGMHE